MIKVRFAKIEDMSSLMTIDPLAAPQSRRFHLIQHAINDQRCLVAEGGQQLVGFALFNRRFYDNMFLELVVVREENRRCGVATALINHVQRISTTQKLFTSTNRSNRAAQELFVSCGFEESGYIGNLDPGDPEIVYFKRIVPPNK